MVCGGHCSLLVSLGEEASEQLNIGPLGGRNLHSSITSPMQKLRAKQNSTEFQTLLLNVKKGAGEHVIVRFYKSHKQ